MYISLPRSIFVRGTLGQILSKTAEVRQQVTPVAGHVMLQKNACYRAISSSALLGR